MCCTYTLLQVQTALEGAERQLHAECEGRLTEWVHEHVPEVAAQHAHRELRQLEQRELEQRELEQRRADMAPPPQPEPESELSKALVTLRKRDRKQAKLLKKQQKAQLRRQPPALEVQPDEPQPEVSASRS